MYDKKEIRKKCKIAIDNILKEGTTDVELFNRPFELEYLEIEHIRKNITDTIVDSILLNKFEDLRIHKIGHVLIPKKDLCDFRKCALVDIVDEIKYLTLVLLVASEVEKMRVSKSKNRIFSYRLNINNGNLFDPHYNYTAFRKEVDRKSKIKTNKVLVECDISNFYDRLNIHRIESTLLSMEKVDTDIVKLINELLLFWANRDSYGIPVGSNGSRILAEASLINVDQVLLSHGIDFCRFVDDYRIFARDADTAHRHLAVLTQSLSREGLFINVHKTKIKDISNIKSSELSQDNESTTVSEMREANSNNNSDKNVQNLPKIIRGYNGLIPTKYREIPNKEKEELLTIDPEEWIKKISKSVLIASDEIKKTLKLIDTHNRYDLLKNISTIIKKFPQFIPYFVDFYIKKQEKISNDIANVVTEAFKEWYIQHDVPEYILVYLVRLFSVRNEDKEVLLQAFRNSKRVAGDYIGRALLESFNGKLTRREVLEIRDYYVRADQWERRQILRLIQGKLPVGEKRAFFKDVRIHNTDEFVEYIIMDKDKMVKTTKK